MNTRSIRFRLIAWYAGLLSGLFVVFGVFMYFAVSRLLENNIRSNQMRRADAIAQLLVSRGDQVNASFIKNEISTSYMPELNNRFIRITGAEGTLLYVSGDPRDGAFDSSEIPLLHSTNGLTPFRKVKLSGEVQVLIATVIVGKAGGPQYVIETGTSLVQIHNVEHRLVIGLILGLPVALLVAVGGGYLLVGKALAPVDQIARSAEQMTLHNLKGRLPVAHTGDELERLSIAVNHMISRLDEAFQLNSRFMADASHELRTPLTILRGELETVLQQTSHMPEVQEKIGSMLEEVVRISKIVESLFAISRLDAGEAQAEWVKFDLADLVATTADQMYLLAEDKKISIACNAPQAVTVAGDRARIKQIVVNLLDNAIKYTPAGGKIDLNVTANGKAGYFEVSDNGIGIPASALPRVFERFFRVDPARSREVGGAGIGLSIVKSICLAHGGQVSVQSDEGKGSRFKVELPLAAGETEKKSI